MVPVNRDQEGLEDSCRVDAQSIGGSSSESMVSSCECIVERVHAELDPGIVEYTDSRCRST
ncbi:MAG: hypothetical protein RLZ37_525 [Actinomycetota bacterium]